MPNGEVRDIGQMLNDPQLAAREMVQTLMHPTIGATRVIGTPIKLSDTPASLRSAPPVLGQHTDAVLGELGYAPRLPTADRRRFDRADCRVASEAERSKITQWLMLLSSGSV